MAGLEFTEEELSKIFDFICQQGSKGTDSTDQQKQQLDRKAQKATTRFTFKQLHDAVLLKRDENWIFQSFIKIHGVVLQKNLSYKRLFLSWRDKNSKTGPGRASQKELKAGLKKLRAGLTQDEIEKLMSSIPFEGKDNSIGAADFERIVVQGAKKLEEEKSFEKLLIQEWITNLNAALDKERIPLDRVFYEHDTQQKGSLSFEEFVLLNEFLGLSFYAVKQDSGERTYLQISKKDLKKTFDIIDRTKQGRVRLEDIKQLSSILESDDTLLEEDDNMKLEGEELKRR